MLIFSTLSLDSHESVREVIEKSLTVLDDVIFKVESFREMNHENIFGARYEMSFEANSGAKKKFQVDIVYKLATDIKIIKTPLSSTEFNGSSIENIICDKINAVLTKITYSTRVKDYDDLWRISNNGIDINSQKLKKLLAENSITDTKIDFTKIGDATHKGWIKQKKRYKDLPNLEDVVNEINEWLTEVLHG
jgi:hypothetical protein